MKQLETCCRYFLLTNYKRHLLGICLNLDLSTNSVDPLASSCIVTTKLFFSSLDKRYFCYLESSQVLSHCSVSLPSITQS